MDTTRLPRECVSVRSLGIRDWERMGGGEVCWGKLVMSEREGVRPVATLQSTSWRRRRRREGLGEKSLKWAIPDLPAGEGRATANIREVPHQMGMLGLQLTPSTLNGEILVRGPSPCPLISWDRLGRVWSGVNDARSHRGTAGHFK